MIHIACCFDRNFEISFSVLASSIERHSHSDVMIHAFHDGPLEYVKSAVRKTEKFKVEFCDVTGAYSKYPLAGHQTKITFARLYLHELLNDVARVIYLDVDMIVRRDLADLFNVDLHGKPIAAVIDYPMVLLAEQRGVLGTPNIQYRADEYICKTLGMKNAKNYFNSGLLVIDLAQYAASGALERIERFLMQKEPPRVFNDQDALNVALEENVEFLDPRWNCMPVLISQAKHGPISKEIESVLKLYDEPWLIHFAGRKPWNSIGSPDPWDRYFWEDACEMLPLNARHLLLWQLKQAEHQAEQLQQVEHQAEQLQQVLAEHKALLRSRSRLAKAWWRTIRWKLGIRRAPD